MPLIKSKSKKAFKENVEKEMKSGKPQDQSLAIAYAIKRKNPKKMSKGGLATVPEQSRPMPESKANDAAMIQRAPAPKAKTQPMSAPSMVHSKVIKTSKVDALGRKIPDMADMPPQKHKGMSEDKGPAEDEFMSGEMEPQYAEGGMINGLLSMGEAEEDQNPGTPSRKPDDHRLPMDEYMADHFAEGGMIDDMEQPQPEADEDRHASIAAAIMAKRAKMMAKGGQVDIDRNNDEEPNAYYKHNKEALDWRMDEDFEDMSQPLDSNEHGDSREMGESDKHDMISQIRAKMKNKRMK